MLRSTETLITFKHKHFVSSTPSVTLLLRHFSKHTREGVKAKLFSYFVAEVYSIFCFC